MPSVDIVHHLPIVLRADPSRIVIRPFMLADDPPQFAEVDCSRAQRIADRVLGLNGAALDAEWTRVVAGLRDRHRNIDAVLSRRFNEINGRVLRPQTVTPTQALLIGGYFSEEYSFEAAALFNPSIVLHPDQSVKPAGAIRFILSLRGVGEGHISSVTFRTGYWHGDGSVSLDPARVRICNLQ